MSVNPDLKRLASLGVHFPEARDFLTPEIRDRLAMDAEPVIGSTPNAGIPSYLNTYVDPGVIEYLFIPNKIAQIVGEEVQKGDWVTPTAVFIQSEATGEVSTYGDNNENGVSGVNVTFPQRQNYVYQAMLSIGDKEADQMALARINLMSAKQKSVATVMGKAANTIYAFGVAGLQNYGLLNDPSLIAPIAPLPETVGGATVTTWEAKDGAGIYGDVQALYNQMIVQTGGLVARDDKLVLAMSPESEAQLTKTNTYNVNVSDQIKKNFPNLRVETAIQYATQSGQLVQLIAEEIDGQRTAVAAYSEKMRAHRMVMRTSSMHQKYSQGVWGVVIFRPLAIAQLLGV